MSYRFCGKVVAYMPTTAANTRNSEGTFFRLKDRSIIYAYSYYGGSSEDSAAANIACLVSRDNGESFGEWHYLYKKDDGDNYMCPSILRMKNGDLGLFMLYRVNRSKVASENERNGKVLFVRSADEGLTWSEPLVVTPKEENYVLENGHVIRFKNGRILVPVANCIRDEQSDTPSELVFFVSDDDGLTWREIADRKRGVPRPWSESGLQEPIAFECDDGIIRTYSRTDLGCQYETDSSDDGETWSEPMPNRTFSSPCSPMNVKRFGKYCVAAFNPVPKYVIRHYDRDERSPLILLFSIDGGKTYDWEKTLIVDNRGHCCYPDLFDIGDGCLLIGYQALNDGVIKKLDHWHYVDFYEVSCSETEGN
ncbi:MAG: exo-alpha-sialidase [Clostridia bacterium]|nr:exo-alpha-sialidase [Clostridia bacterium]